MKKLSSSSETNVFEKDSNGLNSDNWWKVEFKGLMVDIPDLIVEKLKKQNMEIRDFVLKFPDDSYFLVVSQKTRFNDSYNNLLGIKENFKLIRIYNGEIEEVGNLPKPCPHPVIIKGRLTYAFVKTDKRLQVYEDLNLIYVVVKVDKKNKAFIIYWDKNKKKILIKDITDFFSDGGRFDEFEIKKENDCYRVGNGKYMNKLDKLL